MGKITKKQFLLDVRHEIDMLKKHATNEEKRGLDFSAFDPEMPQKCIYGQMTGICTSSRAKELMDLSCIRQMNTSSLYNILNKNFSEAVEFINGEYNANTWKRSGRNYCYLSALEGYINLKSAKNKQIIAYIKGETNTLTL